MLEEEWREKKQLQRMNRLLEEEKSQMANKIKQMQEIIGFLEIENRAMIENGSNTSRTQATPRMKEIEMSWGSTNHEFTDTSS